MASKIALKRPFKILLIEPLFFFIFPFCSSQKMCQQKYAMRTRCAVISSGTNINHSNNRIKPLSRNDIIGGFLIDIVLSLNMTF